MKYFRSFFALAALATISIASLAQTGPSTLIVTGWGEAKQDPDKLVIDVTLSDAYHPEGKDINAVYADFTNLLRRLAIDSKNMTLLRTDVYDPQDGYTPRQETRTYRLALTSNKAFQDLGAQIYSISGASYYLVESTVNDVESLKAKALEAALTDARKKAEKLAQLNGVKLVAMVSVEDMSGPYYPLVNYGYYEDMAYSQPQQVTFTATIKITYSVAK